MVPDRAPYGARPDIVRCLTSAKNIKISLNKSADADVLWVELPPMRSDVFLQMYILHLHRYITSKDQKHKYKNIYFASATEDINMQRTRTI